MGAGDIDMVSLGAEVCIQHWETPASRGLIYLFHDSEKGEQSRSHVGTGNIDEGVRMTVGCLSSSNKGRSEVDGITRYVPLTQL